MIIEITGLAQAASKIDAFRRTLPGQLENAMAFHAACINLAMLTGKSWQEIVEWAEEKSRVTLLTPLQVVRRELTLLSDEMMRELIEWREGERE